MTEVYLSFSSVKDKLIGKTLRKLWIQQEVFPLLLLYTLQLLSKLIIFTGQQATTKKVEEEGIKKKIHFNIKEKQLPDSEHCQNFSGAG